MTLPNDDNPPTQCHKGFQDGCISFHVNFEFRLPESASRLWSGRSWTPGMSMPEATMHEDDGPVFFQRDVRGTWKSARVETKSVALTVRKRLTANSGRVLRPRTLCIIRRRIGSTCVSARIEETKQPLAFSCSLIDLACPTTAFLERSAKPCLVGLGSQWVTGSVPTLI